MKIMHVADLHVDITKNNFKLVNYIVEYLRVEQPDIFVIAGDVGNSSEMLDETLQRFSKIDCLKCFIPGNHDIWFDSKNKLHKGFDSSFKYEVTLKDISAKNNFIYPVFEPYIFKDIAVLGSIGWYDYSLADVRLKGIYDVKDYQYGRFNNMIWADVEYAIWLQDR